MPDRNLSDLPLTTLRSVGLSSFSYGSQWPRHKPTQETSFGQTLSIADPQATGLATHTTTWEIEYGNRPLCVYFHLHI